MATVVNIKPKDSWAGFGQAFTQAFDRKQQAKMQADAQAAALQNQIELERERATIKTQQEASERERITALYDQATIQPAEAEAEAYQVLLEQAGTMDPTLSLQRQAKDTAARQNAKLNLNLSGYYTPDQLSGMVGNDAAKKFGNMPVSIDMVKNLTGVEAQRQNIEVNKANVQVAGAQTKLLGQKELREKAEILKVKAATLPEGVAQRLAVTNAETLERKATIMGLQVENEQRQLEVTKTAQQIKNLELSIKKETRPAELAIQREQLKVKQEELGFAKQKLTTSKYLSEQQVKIATISYNKALIGLREAEAKSGNNSVTLDFIKSSLLENKTFSEYYTNKAGEIDQAKLTSVATFFAKDKNNDAFLKYVMAAGESDVWVDPGKFDPHGHTIAENFNSGAISAEKRPGMVKLSKLKTAISAFDTSAESAAAVKERKYVRSRLISIGGPKVADSIMSDDHLGPLVEGYIKGTTDSNMRLNEAAIFAEGKTGAEYNRLKDNDKKIFQSFYARSILSVLNGVVELKKVDGLTPEMLQQVPDYTNLQTSLQAEIRKQFASLGGTEFSDDQYSAAAVRLVNTLETDNTFLANVLTGAEVTDPDLRTAILAGNVPERRVDDTEIQGPSAPPQTSAPLNTPEEILTIWVSDPNSGVTREELELYAQTGGATDDPVIYSMISRVKQGLEAVKAAYVAAGQVDYAVELDNMISTPEAFQATGFSTMTNYRRETPGSNTFVAEGSKQQPTPRTNPLVSIPGQ